MMMMHDDINIVRQQNAQKINNFSVDFGLKVSSYNIMYIL